MENSTNAKKFKQSPIVIACYILAACMFVYAVYTGISTVSNVKEYYESYGMSASGMEIVTYVAQSMLEPLIHAFTFFMAGLILNAVRKLDQRNYVEAKPSSEKTGTSTRETPEPADADETVKSEVEEVAAKTSEETAG